MELLTIISITLTVAGVGLLSYGFYEAKELRELLETGELKEAWDTLSILIIMFLIGYLALLLQLVGVLPVDLSMTPVAQILVSSVFALGSVFVAATARLNKEVYRV